MCPYISSLPLSIPRTSWSQGELEPCFKGRKPHSCPLQGARWHNARHTNSEPQELVPGEQVILQDLRTLSRA